MNLSKLKAFLCCWAVSIFLFLCTLIYQVISNKEFANSFKSTPVGAENLTAVIFIFLVATLSLTALFYLLGVYNFLFSYFNGKYQEKQRYDSASEKIVMDTAYARAMNQVKLDYLMEVAKIQIESNRYLMSLYENAKSNQRQNNLSLAYQQLALIEEELRKQGYNL